MSIKGLTTEEAKKRLEIYGYNKLKEEKPKTVFQMFLAQIATFTNFILGVAIVIAFILQDYTQAGIMVFIVALNACIGVIQEGKAQKALEALQKMSVLKATVFRDGETIEISSEELVPGDIVILEAGKQVPADLKLIETVNLKIDEKALTGESVPVEKDSEFVPENDTVGVGDRLDLAYMSTLVTYGRGMGEVVKTGMKTEIGKIAEMVGKEKETPSPLQKAMDELSKVLGYIVIAVCVIVFGVGIFQGRDMLEMLMISVSLAVAAIPEGLPTIVTIVLALGMQKMAKLNAIVKTLPAVETLGSVSYVCSDKTGTLTQNKMTVIKAVSRHKYLDLNNVMLDKENLDLVRGFLLCNDAVITKDGEEIGDPTETALVAFASNYGMLKSDTESEFKRINEQAFDSDRKLMTTVHDNGKGVISYTKGSTDELLKRCTKIVTEDGIKDITEKDKETIMDKMSEMSQEALRVLSLAMRFDNKDAVEEDLVYVGMVGMIDPERPEVIESVRIFNGAGVKTIMITGDHKDTALAIAKKLGIASSPDECIMGHELEAMSDEELKERAKTLSIFARVSPEHKVRIVKAFQDNGNIVSMTGDGVNDAPSLKAADVGVAMGITGTDVAKGAADIILQDDSFTTIEKAIKEGRNIYENVKKSIIFALSSNVSEVITMFVAILLGFASPLLSIHILWVNLLTDSLPCFALGVDTNSSFDVMKKQPRKNGESVFANGGIKQIVIHSLVIATMTLIGFMFPAIMHMNANNMDFSFSTLKSLLTEGSPVIMQAQTYAFTTLALAELLHAIGMRDAETSIFKFKWLDNKVMILAFFVGVLGQFLVTEVPFLTKAFETISLSPLEWLGLMAFSTIPLVVHEIEVLIHKFKKHK